MDATINFNVDVVVLGDTSGNWNEMGQAVQL